MTKKHLGPFSFFMALLLFFSFSFPTQAATPLSPSLMWEKSFNSNGWLHDEFHASSTNDTFISTFTIKEESNYKNTYFFDIMKVNQNGKTTKDFNIEADEIHFYEDKTGGYIIAFSLERQVVEVYNEDFERIHMMEPSASFEFLGIDTQDEFIAVGVLNTATKESETHTYYIADLSPTENIDFPVTPSYGMEVDGQYIIYGRSFDKQDVEMVSIDADQIAKGADLGYATDIVERDGYFYVAIGFSIGEFSWGTRNSYTGLFQIDQGGNILQKNILETDYIIQLGNKFIGIENFKYVYYDFASLQKQVVFAAYTDLDPYLSLNKLSEDLFVYTLNGKSIFANDKAITQYIRPDFSHYVPLDEKHFVDMKGGIQEYYLYDIKTGNLVDIDPYGLPRLSNGKIAVLTTDWWDSGTYTYKYTVKMYTTEPLKTDAYLPDKTWTITFNSEVDAHTVSEDTIYVIDENNHKVEGLTFTTKDKKVEVHAPTLGYDRGKTYTLHVTPAVQSSNGIALKQESTKVFTIQ